MQASGADGPAEEDPGRGLQLQPGLLCRGSVAPLPSNTALGPGDHLPHPGRLVGLAARHPPGRNCRLHCQGSLTENIGQIQTTIKLPHH